MSPLLGLRQLSLIHRVLFFSRIYMKPSSLQIQVMKSVRKHTIFVGKPYGTAKGAKGYNRNKQKNWRKEI